MIMSVTEGITILETLDAHKASIASKQTEMAGLESEKQTLIQQLDYIEDTILPTLRAEKTKLENQQVTNIANNDALIKAAYDKAYSTKAGTASFVLAVSKAKFDQDKENAATKYSDAAEEASKWAGWYDNGCKADYGSFEGAYCGKRALGCTNRSKGDFNQLAPSRCLKSQYRDARKHHAQSKKATTALAATNALTAKTAAAVKPEYLKNAETNRAAAIKAYNDSKLKTSPMQSTEKAISDKTFEIAKYIGSDGIIEKKEQRVSFVTQEIGSLTDQLVVLATEKYAAEQAYQAFISKAVADQAVIDNAERDAEAKRLADAAILDASIEANLIDVETDAAIALDPNLENRTVVEAKAKNNTAIYALAGLALIVGGIYIIKK